MRISVVASVHPGRLTADHTAEALHARPCRRSAVISASKSMFLAVEARSSASPWPRETPRPGRPSRGRHRRRESGRLRSKVQKVGNVDQCPRSAAARSPRAGYAASRGWDRYGPPRRWRSERNSGTGGHGPRYGCRSGGSEKDPGTGVVSSGFSRPSPEAARFAGGCRARRGSRPRFRRHLDIEDGVAETRIARIGHSERGVFPAARQSPRGSSPRPSS